MKVERKTLNRGEKRTEVMESLDREAEREQWGGARTEQEEQGGEKRGSRRTKLYEDFITEHMTLDANF